jgi:hypothetical protein
MNVMKDVLKKSIPARSNNKRNDIPIYMRNYDVVRLVTLAKVILADIEW